MYSGDLSQLDVLNFLPDPVFAVDNEGTIIAWNRAMEVLSGKCACDIIGRQKYSLSIQIYGFSRHSLVDFILSGDPEILKEYTSFSCDGDIVEAEISYSRSSSDTRILWGKASPLKSKTGEIIGAIETIRDITRQKQLEVDLKDNEERYHSIFTNNHSVMLIIDPVTGDIIDANPYACKYYGYSHEALVTMNIFEINQLSHEEIFREMNLATLEKRTYFEFRHKVASGEIRDVEVFSGPISLCSHQFLYSIVHDVTEKKAIEYRLMDSEEQYRSLVESSEFGVIITRGMILTYANPAALTILGFNSFDDVEGRLFSDLVAQDSKHCLMGLFDINARNGRAESGFKIVRPDKLVRTLEIRSVPISIKGSVYIQSSFLDVTEQRELENAISLTNKKLNLLSSLTRHDILNKLSVLDLSFDLLKDSDSVELRIDILESMKKTVDDLIHLMEFTRMYQDLGINSPGWYRLKTLINHAMAFFSDPNTLPVIQDQIPDIEIFTDPLIEQVLYNLFENTIRHGKQATKIRFSWIELAESCQLIYEDDGIGILTDEKELVFERGFGKNTGFGLFLTREILSITHISIRETGSSPGGVRFEMTIPKTVCRSRGFHPVPQ